MNIFKKIKPSWNSRSIIFFFDFCDLTHLHILFVFCFLKVPNFSADLYLCLEILILIFHTACKLLFSHMHVFSCFFSNLLQRFFLFKCPSKIHRLIFFIQPLLYLLFAAEILEFFRVFQKILGKFPNHLQFLLWSNCYAIQNINVWKVLNNVNFIVGILDRTNCTSVIGLSINESICMNFGSWVGSISSIWLLLRLRPTNFFRDDKFSTVDIRLSFRAKY